MKLLFVHDHRFHVRGKDVFSGGSFSYEVFKRYLNSFEEVVVVGRRAESSTDQPGNLTLASGDGVVFDLVPNFSSPISVLRRRRAIHAHLDPLIAKTGALAARLPSELGLAAFWRALRRVRPYPRAIEMVGCAWDATYYHSTLASFYAPIAAARNRRAAAGADQILYVTEDFLQRRYPSPAFQIACSNVEVTPIAEELLGHRSLRGNPKAAVRLGICCNVDVEYKGVDTALEAIKLLADHGFNVFLEVLGGGAGTRIRKIAKVLGLESRLALLGPLPSGEAVFGWMDSLDQYWQPSRQEGLPRALIEAMARGVPAIGSTAGGIPELLPESRLFDPTDAKSLARISAGLVVSEDARDSASKEGWKTAKCYKKSILDGRREAFWHRARMSAEGIHSGRV